MSDDYAKVNASWGAGYHRLTEENAELRAEIERLRAALMKYADDNYNGFNGDGAYARRALAPAKEPAETK